MWGEGVGIKDLGTRGLGFSKGLDMVERSSSEMKEKVSVLPFFFSLFLWLPFFFHLKGETAGLLLLTRPGVHIERVERKKGETQREIERSLGE